MQAILGAIAHNPFIVDTLTFISYYHDGLQVWSIADPANPVHVGYFDTDTTIGGGSNYPGFEGCWGTYPFFPSGTIIASDRDNGLFTVTLDGWVPPPPPPLPVGLTDAERDLVLNIYPNPANNKVTIALEEPVNEILEFELFSTEGKRVARKRFDGKFGVFDVDLGSVQRGLYMVRLTGPSIEKRSRLILE